MPKSSKLKIASVIVTVGFIVAYIFHRMESRIFHLGYPFNTYLFDPHDQFMDWFHTYKQDEFLSPYLPPFDDTFVSNYFPFTHVLTWPLSLFNYHTSLIIFLAVFCLGLFFFNWTFLRISNRRQTWINLFVFTTLTYPAQFVFDRANVEAWLFLLIGFFFIFFIRRKYYWSAAFLAPAIAMKVYPGLLILILLQKRKFAAAAYCLTLVCVLTAASLAVLSGGIFANASALASNLAHLNNNITDGAAGLQHSSSFFAFLSLSANLLGYTPWSDAAARSVILQVCTWFTIAFLIATFVSVLRKDLVLWERATLIIAAMILIPKISYDYKLVSVLLAFLLFVCSKTSRNESLIFTVLFAGILVPKSYYIYFADVSVSSLLNPLLLLIISFWIIFKGFGGEKAWLRLRREKNKEFAEAHS